MSKKQFKSQASSSRAAAAALGGGFGSSTFATTSSLLSYVSEPPSLSGISDSNLVVSFKNLSKKDSTTKAKALEELQAYVSLHKQIEDAALEAWIKSYPRTSIDNSRRVRQLSHTLQGHISTVCGKRIAKFLPEISGAWLSGLYDNDKAVTKAAQDSFSLVFATPEKLINVRKAYQSSIIEYCRNVIDNETVMTLSDERTVTPDDAEAKYSRVISAALSVIGDLLDKLLPEDTTKYQAEYNEILGNDKLWSLISQKDPQVRRSVLRFLRLCLAKQPDVVVENLNPISKSLLSNGLISDQTGTSYELVGTIIKLSATHPTIWTDHYTGKKSVEHRLRSFLKRGSQSGSREFWSAVPELVRVLPKQVLPQDAPTTVDFLSAMHGGIIKKDEPRMNIGAAYNAYTTVAALITEPLETSAKSKVLEELLFPIIQEFVQPKPETSDWAIPGPQAASVIPSLTQTEVMADVFVSQWPKLTVDLIDAIKSSAPEKSKDYQKSQDSVAALARRWAVVQSGCLKSSHVKLFRSVLENSSRNLIAESVSLLASRNGKPYCAAAAIASVLRLSPPSATEELAANISNFLPEELPKIILSPSSSHLISILYLSKDSPQFPSAWAKCVEIITADTDSPTSLATIEELLSSSDIPPDFELALEDLNLQQFILKRLRASLDSDTEWTLLGRILKQSAKLLAKGTSDDMLVEMTKGLSLSEWSLSSLHAIDQVARHSPRLLRDYVPSAEGTNLLRALLLLGESADETVAQEASSLSASIQALLTQDSSDPTSKKAVFDVIQEGLSEATATSVTVETLVELARKVLDDQQIKNQDALSSLLPPSNSWTSALEPFLNFAPKASFAVTNPLGGVLYLVKQSASASNDHKDLPRDINGFSAAYRIAAYVVGLLDGTSLFDLLSIEIRASVFELLQLTVLLANDNLGIAGSNNLWGTYSSEYEADALDFVSKAQSLISTWLNESQDWWAEETGETGETRFSFVNKTLRKFLQKSNGSSPVSFYHARAFGTLTADLVEKHGWQSKHTESIETAFKTNRRSGNIFTTAALITGYRVPFSFSKVIARACNEWVADLTGLKIDEKPQEAIVQITLLNLILQHQDDAVDNIAKQRVVFLVKHVIAWLQQGQISVPLQAETYRLLSVVFPAMKDMYGSHWNDTLDSITNYWIGTKQLDGQDSDTDSNIPVVHATLRLYGTFQSLIKDEEPNDDLVDALNDTQEAAARGLINILKTAQHFPDEFHQSLRIVNGLLARRISEVSLKHIDDPAELYPLLYVQSGPVQRTAFEILHKHIPAIQEQVSFDAALEKKEARLPEELLSLILDSPTLDAFTGMDFERGIPLSLRGYLFSWLLLFDHFENSSYKVKNDYIEHIKQEDYLSGLLNYMFDFLGHGRGRPVDITSLDVTTYTPDVLDPPEKDAQWLLTYIYFLCLKHLPTLTKTWWIDCKSRAKVLAVHSWTEKFLSPHIIGYALSSVAEWSATQSTHTPDESEQLTIKISHRAGEIKAFYTIDEQIMAMQITLPPTYPLDPANVEGIQRVAVAEAKWQSWLRNTRGVITFSNGSIVDGLVTFRKNVVGTLKGQTECAICYSIVGSDKQLPTKRCGTCKNLFHGVCLFKWFKTSGGSGCPLCRNPFNYA